MIKSYTDISQSRHLLEIGISPESADMYYERATIRDKYSEIPIIREEDDHFEVFPQDLPCWSLSALLELMPTYEINNFGDSIQLDCNDYALETEEGETLLDLAVDMVCYLKEQNHI